MRRIAPEACPGIGALMLEMIPMPDLSLSTKSVITVSEMADLCQLSRSRFYDLIEAGVFPKPALHPSSKRPMYDRALIEKCLEIKETGIGANGLPVLFNRKPTRAGRKPVRKPTQGKTQDQADLLAALKGLGLTTTAQVVGEALAVLFPTGH